MSTKQKQLFSNDAIMEVLDPDTLTLHPVVLLFPELNARDFEALVNSIRAHGQIDPVWITNENEIIDGRHRWRAQKKLGSQVQCRRLKNYHPELLTSIIDHCIAQNLTRRHLNKDQRAVIAADLEQKRIKAAAAQEMGELSLHGGDDFPWHTFDELLSTFRINKSQYERGNRLLRFGEPEIIEACANGTITLGEASLVSRKKVPFDRDSVLACLDSPDPGEALHNLYIKQIHQQNSQKYRDAVEYYYDHTIYRNYYLISEIDEYCESVTNAIHRAFPIDWKSAWEKREEIEACIVSMKETISCIEIIVWNLENSRPSLPETTP